MHQEGEIEGNKESVVGFMNQMQNQFNSFFLKANEDASLTGNELRAYQTEFSSFMTKMHVNTVAKTNNNKELIKGNTTSLSSKIENLKMKEA